MENKELLEKARQAGSPEELLALARENGYPLDENEAREYFERLGKSGELSDDELDSVSGGGCYYGDGRLVVTCGYYCKRYKCKVCGKEFAPSFTSDHICTYGKHSSNCSSCAHKSNKGARMLCNHPENYKR